MVKKTIMLYDIKRESLKKSFCQIKIIFKKKSLNYMSEYNPTQVFDNYWVYALEQEAVTRYPSQDGKWMMFFHISEMDTRWNQACNLYRSGKLFGVNSMKASTAQQNPMPERLHGPDEGIIIFYCGPSEDEANVMQYGRNILNHMNYPRETFYYKSDKPHLIDWNRQYRHLYSINTIQHYNGNRNLVHNFSFSDSISPLSKSFLNKTMSVSTYPFSAMTNFHSSNLNNNFNAQLRSHIFHSNNQILLGFI